MDSPRLRRRNTLSLDPRRRCLLLRAHKSNPHIGWSRHFPDSSYLSYFQPPSSCSTTAYPGSLKSSPYVGWFRHAPATVKVFTNTGSHNEFYERHARKWLEEEVRLLLASMPKSLTKGKDDGVRCLHELLCTRLPGGNDSNARKMTPQGSLMLFQTLRAWLSFPFHEDESIDSSWNLKSIGQDHSRMLDDEVSEGDSESESEEKDLYCHHCTMDGHSVDGAPEYVGQNALDIGISSQAEAYYAHQVTNELTVNPDDHTTVLPTPSSSRLDYVITQMDIVRMHRNASRHLDVESIYKLPTITYRAPRKRTMEVISETDDKSVEGWSWMFIPEDKALDGSSLVLEGESAHDAKKKESSVCVICMEPFEDGDRLRVLPCNHAFHVGCIDRWLSGSCSFDDCYTAGCPTCKNRADTGPHNSNLDGSVPSWAFAQLGRSLARDCADT